MSKLAEFLNQVSPGAIPTDKIEELKLHLIEAWPLLHGSSDGGMKPEKLYRDLEKCTLEYPKLKFSIERHGGTVQGSSRAEIQHWTIDALARTATLGQKTGHRQLRRRSRPMDIGQKVQEVIGAVKTRTSSQWVTFISSEMFKVSQLSAFIPANNAQTGTAHRKRFRKELMTELKALDWEPVEAKRDPTFRRIRNQTKTES